MRINAYCSKPVRDGAIGKVKEVIVYNFEGPAQWKPTLAQPIPDGLDWHLWCNQVELRPYHRSLHFGWANYEAYDGGGQSWGITGWGTHSLDQVQCALEDTSRVPHLPKQLLSVLARLSNLLTFATFCPLAHCKSSQIAENGFPVPGKEYTCTLFFGKCNTGNPRILTSAHYRRKFSDFAALCPKIF